RVLVPLLAPTLIVVGLLGFMSAARDISTIVLLGSSQSRTMALLALDYAFGGQFERGSVVAFMTSLVVIVTALISHLVGQRWASASFRPIRKKINPNLSFLARVFLFIKSFQFFKAVQAVETERRWLNGEQRLNSLNVWNF